MNRVRGPKPLLLSLVCSLLGLGIPPDSLAAATGAEVLPARVLGDVAPLWRPEYAGGRAGRSAGQLASADTVWVFRDSLETLVSPNAEGLWTHEDGSAQPAAWHIDTTYACEGQSFWCGRIDSSWVGDPNRFGYDNGWIQTLSNFVDLSGGVSPVKLSLRHQMDIEPDYDVATIEVFDPDEDWIAIATFTGVVHGTGGADCDTFTVQIPDSIIAKYNPIHFRFAFRSDAQFSSADGFYPGDGWSVDNVTIRAGLTDIRFFDDFESGPGTWTMSLFPPVGDFWRVQSDVPTEDACTTNASRAWIPTLPATGGLVARMDDRLISPPVAVNAADQVFAAFDVYRNLPFLGCMYYNVFFRTRNIADPGWSGWTDPTGVLYFGTEREWLRQTIALAGAAGKDSVQVRIGVKDYSLLYCDGVASTADAAAYIDNFAVGIIGLSGPVLALSETNLYQDTFGTTPFFGDDNFNAARGDSLALQVATSRGLKEAFLHYSFNGGAFATQPLTAVGSAAPNAYFADVPAGAYPRGTQLRYYFSATDSTDEVASLPEDAVAGSHYYTATILPAIQAVAPFCAGDTARVLYVNAFSGPDGATAVDSSLGAIGLRYDRYDVNAPSSGLGNSPGGADSSSAILKWPAVPLATLGMYGTIVWDVGQRAAATLSAKDQLLLQSWLALPGRNRGLLIAGDNLANDLAVNGGQVGSFLTCTMGVQHLRDLWENTPQDSVTPTLTGAAGTILALEPFPVAGGCPVLNRFDALAISSCAGASGGSWLRYPNNLLAATVRRGDLGAGDSSRAILFGYSIPVVNQPIRRNLLLYRTLVDAMETERCYTTTGVEGGAAAPAAPGLRVHRAAPNPFNPHTTIRFELGRAARVRVEIFDIAGARVRSLGDRRFAAGTHRVPWDGTDGRGRALASGAYLVRIAAEGEIRSQKVILLR